MRHVHALIFGIVLCSSGLPAEAVEPLRPMRTRPAARPSLKTRVTNHAKRALSAVRVTSKALRSREAHQLRRPAREQADHQPIRQAQLQKRAGVATRAVLGAIVVAGGLLGGAYYLGHHAATAERGQYTTSEGVLIDKKGVAIKDGWQIGKVPGLKVRGNLVETKAGPYKWVIAKSDPTLKTGTIVGIALGGHGGDTRVLPTIVPDIANVAGIKVDRNHLGQSTLVIVYKDIENKGDLVETTRVLGPEAQRVFTRAIGGGLGRATVPLASNQPQAKPKSQPGNLPVPKKTRPGEKKPQTLPLSREPVPMSPYRQPPTARPGYVIIPRYYRNGRVEYFEVPDRQTFKNYDFSRYRSQ